MKEIIVLRNGYDIAISLELNDKYQITGGYLSEPGWYWGDVEKYPQLALIRIIFSRLYEQFVKEAEKVGFTLEKVKSILLEGENYRDALYGLTGDNSFWDYELYRQADNVIYMEIEEMEEIQQLPVDEEIKRKIVDRILYLSTDLNLDFEDFYEKHKEEWEERYRNTVQEANSWQELEEKIRELNFELEYEILDELLCLYRQSVEKVKAKIIDEILKEEGGEV